MDEEKVYLADSSFSPIRAQFWKTIKDEGSSDRSIALVAGSYLDAALDALLRARQLEVPEVEELLGERGPLGTLAAKVDAAYVLGLVTKAASSSGTSEASVCRLPGSARVPAIVGVCPGDGSRQP
jgi:hypothetical protein